MFVPEPVISLSIRPEGKETPNFSRALNRFQKEDPTFRVHVDSESQEVGLPNVRRDVPLMVTDDHFRHGRAAFGDLCRADEARVQRALRDGQAPCRVP